MSPTAIRWLPAVAVGVVAILSAAMARRFGAGQRGQVFAAFSVGFMGVLLGEGHLLSTAVFDFALWTVALWLMVRILSGEDPQLWLAVGVTVGIGLQNKHTIAFLAVAILFALVVSPPRRLLRSRYPWLGVVIAMVIAAPNLLWQAANGWPQLEMAEALSGRSDGPLAFLLFQPLLLSVTLAIPAVAGWWWLAFSREADRWRPLAFAYVFLLIVFLLLGGKNYYIAPMYSVLLAAGGRWFDRLTRAKQAAMAVFAAVGVIIGVPIALPVLPVEQMGALDLTGELGETVGWPELVDQVAEVHGSIPDELRPDATVFTVAYGEAGAIDVLGGSLPPAFSSHNNYWIWGPPPEHGPIIGVGAVRQALAPICPDVRQVATLGNPAGVENESRDAPVYLCLRPEGQLREVWPLIRHYN